MHVPPSLSTFSHAPIDVLAQAETCDSTVKFNEGTTVTHPHTAHLRKREARPCEIHHALIWCSNCVRRFLRDRQSDVPEASDCRACIRHAYDGWGSCASFASSELREAGGSNQGSEKRRTRTMILGSKSLTVNDREKLLLEPSRRRSRRLQEKSREISPDASEDKGGERLPRRGPASGALPEPYPHYLSEASGITHQDSTLLQAHLSVALIKQAPSSLATRRFATRFATRQSVRHASAKIFQ